MPTEPPERVAAPPATPVDDLKYAILQLGNAGVAIGEWSAEHQDLDPIATEVAVTVSTIRLVVQHLNAAVRAYTVMHP